MSGATAADQGIVGVGGGARRLQVTITHLVVWLPALGAAAAALQLARAQVQTWEPLLLAGMYVATLTGVELGFHRYASHQAFGTTRPMWALLVVLGSMAAQGPVLYWAATHRRHHAFSDKSGDPHSPLPRAAGQGGRLRGLVHGHMGWLFAPVQTDWLRYVQDLLKDRTLFRLNRQYFMWVGAGLLLPAVFGWVWTGQPAGALRGLVWGGLLRIFLVHHAVWGVNSICHVWGARAFRALDDSRNNALLALPSLGGSWHNNHHAFPYTADNRMAWWQFDFCGLVVRLLAAAGLAWDVRYPTAEQRRGRALAPAATNLGERTP